MFAEEISFFSFIGPFLQSFSEARGALVSVLRLIDEVNLSELTFCDQVWCRLFVDPI
jgi:ABC-type multidrug transport system fused ATPase/permease subunit